MSSGNWLRLADARDLLTRPTQFSGLEEYRLPAQRVLAAAVQLESRNVHISRIRSIVIADAIDTHINSTGSARMNLQLALEHLARGFRHEDLKSLISWRKAGEWLLDFFQQIPLGAICMMDRQTSLYVMPSYHVWSAILIGLRWGNVIGTGYVGPIVAYCRSLPGFVLHAKKMTPAICQAIRDWSSGCGYHLEPGSSLGSLIQKQEKAYASTDAAETRLHEPISSLALSETSHDETEEVWEPNSTDNIAPNHNCGANGGICSVMPPPPEEITENIAAPGIGEELLSSAPQSTPARSTFFVRVGADSSLNDGGYPLMVSYSPSPPQALLIPDIFLRVLKVYFEDSCRKMTFDENGLLLSPDGAEFRNDICNDFDSYCFTATILKERGLHAEFGRTLSKACDLVKPILRAEHPRTLACFFEVLIHLIQTGLSEVAFALRDFIKRMSAEIDGREKIWSQLYRLLGQVDPESLVHVMVQGWSCTTDVFDGVLGSSHRLAVSVRLDYVKRVMITNYSEEERLLRNLLARFEGTPRHPTPRVMLNLAHNLNRQGRHDETEEVALDVWYMLQQNTMYAGRKAESIESLKVISRSQFIQGKTLEAETTMREAIQSIVNHWGQGHPWVFEFMNVLEGWLRHWNREEDAEALRGEIEDFVGHDVIDE